MAEITDALAPHRAVEARKGAERMGRIDANYQREIAAALAHDPPLTLTAAAIEAERAEWVAAPDATGND